VCTRGSNRAPACGPSTSPLAVPKIRLRRVAGFASLVLVGAQACSAQEASPLTPAGVPASECDATSVEPVGLFRRGAALVSPHMFLNGRPPPHAQQYDAEIRKGIACLDKAVQLQPNYWQALWVRGKAYQALGEARAARDSFQSAFSLQPENPDVGRELVLAHLELLEYGEALPIAKLLADTYPKDAGLRTNYALVLVLDGQIGLSETVIADALQLDPSDTVTRALKTRIDEVAKGDRPKPRTVHDLEK
jgi:tetratricopeptide repeat protein